MVDTAGRLTEINKVVARRTLAGQSNTKLARELGIDRKTIWRMLQKPEVLQYMDDLQKPLEADLAALERLALLVKAKVLAAALEMGASEKSIEIADRAATDMLNRAGQRGTPVTTTETKSLALTGDAATVFISNALRDPGVQRILEQNPEVKAKLLGPATDAQPAG